MPNIKVDVALYGSIARYGGGSHVAKLEVELESGSGKEQLLQKLGIPNQEKGYVFLNSVLCDVPGMTVPLDGPLVEGDHLGIFSTTHMWPYQYRDGAPMTNNLKKALAETGAMHHSYRHLDESTS